MLTAQEQKELIKLSVDNFDKDGAPRKDADKRDLLRVGELLAKVSPEQPTAPAVPVKIKNFVHCELAVQIMKDGAEFQGVEIVNRGTEGKPAIIWREWFYSKPKGNPDRKAVFIQYPQGHQGDAKLIEGGRTIAASAYLRFGK